MRMIQHWSWASHNNGYVWKLISESQMDEENMRGPKNTINQSGIMRYTMLTSWACSNQAGDIVTMPGLEARQRWPGLKNSFDVRQDPVDDPPLNKGWRCKNASHIWSWEVNEICVGTKEQKDLPAGKQSGHQANTRQQWCHQSQQLKKGETLMGKVSQTIEETARPFDLPLAHETQMVGVAKRSHNLRFSKAIWL